MRFAFFKGCKIPHYLPEYGLSMANILKTLGVELVELPFTCCGHQIRDYSFISFIHAAAWNLAIAEKEDLRIVTPCKCCFGNLKHAHHHLKSSPSLKKEINDILKKDNMEWKGTHAPKHLLTVLYHDLGAGFIKNHVTYPLTGLSVAAHYGCHALRPKKITQFDNPLAPVIFEELIEITGATTVDWDRRLECCGNPILARNRELSIELMKNKLADAGKSSADIVCTACTYCQIQFDHVRNEEKLPISSEYPQALLYTTLLARAMGFKH
ncbi:conserved hypothetical protein [Desulfamplus magnetovallimortis]|uniref:Cysteine-rich domain-containing protein n=1 Tax=Desulfamplus magnetovallimortis TaxID=1246637 RepID=A0A1W1HH08_9BACT|nr:CoB--CoM heterodisulfide reductase iron-sulfur subunit B family protein [Desulfamplus magnetovallimortis]SLM31791.1 conserved hypothetical protein [Desulfamplus magnetovallimortis]